jgi:hypothetical protein
MLDPALLNPRTLIVPPVWWFPEELKKLSVRILDFVSIVLDAKILPRTDRLDPKSANWPTRIS